MHKHPTAQDKAYYSQETCESAPKQLGRHELPNNCRSALNLPANLRDVVSEAHRVKPVTVMIDGQAAARCGR